MRIQKNLVRFCAPQTAAPRRARAGVHAADAMRPSFRALVQEGQFFEAAAIAMNEVAHCERVAVPSPEVYLEALRNRGESLLLIGKPMEAKVFLQKGLRLGIEHLGDTAMGVAGIQVLLARALMSVGEMRASLLSARHAMAIFESAPSLPLASVLAFEIMARFEVQCRRLDVATNFIRAAETLMQQRAVNRWEEFRFGMLTEVALSLAREDYNAAGEGVNFELKNAKIYQRQNPLGYALALRNAGEFCVMSQVFDEAEVYFREAIKVVQAAFGDFHADLDCLYDSLARVLLFQGKKEEGLRHSEAFLGLAQARFPEPSVQHAGALTLLSGFHSLLGNNAEAERLEETAMAMLDKIQRQRLSAYKDVLANDIADLGVVREKPAGPSSFFLIFFVSRQKLQALSVDPTDTNLFFESIITSHLLDCAEGSQTYVAPVGDFGFTVVQVKVGVVASKKAAAVFTDKVPAIARAFYLEEVWGCTQARFAAHNVFAAHPPSDDLHFQHTQKIYRRNTAKGELSLAFYLPEALAIHQTCFPTRDHLRSMTGELEERLSAQFVDGVKGVAQAKEASFELRIDCVDFVTANNSHEAVDESVTLHGIVLAFQWGRGELVSAEEVREIARQYLLSQGEST